MKPSLRRRVIALLSVPLLLAASCSRSGDAAPTPSATPTSFPSAEVATATAELVDDVREDAGLDEQADYDSYVVRTHAAGGFSVEAPAAWTDVKSLGVGYTDSVLLLSSESEEYDDVATPGLGIATHARATPAAILAEQRDSFVEACDTAGEVRPYDDRRFRGLAQTYSGCYDTAASEVLVAVESVAGPSFVGYLSAVVVQGKDAAAVGRAMETLTVRR